MNIDVFTRREPDHGETVVFAMVGGGSNNGIGLFFAETVFGGGAISARHKGSHSQSGRYTWVKEARALVDVVGG
jgi:hypothetical protein